ncbi:MULTISPECIES: hypothetical protein [Nocardioides]|uniref:Uncharacterized protein n=1 Tax=Nocardioides salarius TaxID=374513 RepID=A0ABS2MC84_9ACTN|nr:hypothetical protein [Nocardioides salarius]MBM7508784.1 hypothetical protein [Nocardioides salarius]
MKFLVLVLVIVAVVAAWRMRSVLLGKVLGQSSSRVDRHLGRKKR